VFAYLAGVAYCASFVSRASFVHMSTVQSTLAFLLKWASRYVRRYERSVSLGRCPAPAGTAAHSVFYAVCQGIFYIICFKARAIVKLGERGQSFLKEWTWNELLNCPLRPLQFCLESVRLEFPTALRAVLPSLVLRIPEPLTLNGVGPGAHKNIPQVAGAQHGRLGAGAGSRANPLDSFFPFDPYLLFESSKYIDQLYQHWEPISARDRGSPQQDDDASDDDDEQAMSIEEDEDEDEDRDFDGISIEDDGDSEDDDEDDDDDDGPGSNSRRNSGVTLSILEYEDEEDADSDNDSDEGMQHVDVVATSSRSSQVQTTNGSFTTRFVSRW